MKNTLTSPTKPKRPVGRPPTNRVELKARVSADTRAWVIAQAAGRPVGEWLEGMHARALLD